MLNPTQWPTWFQITGLFFTFAMTAGFGIHAYASHVREAADAMSRRRWIYWLYSVAFLLASAASFAQLLISLASRTCDTASLHLGFAALLLVLSYVALLVGVRRRI